MTEQTKITIGVPVYNGEEVIYDRIEQILSQTYQNFIIIISDNCSTDQTQKICEEFVNNNKKIKYFRQPENRGTIWNLDFLINEAKTDYFVWAAADDIWDKEFLEKNIKILEKNKNIVGTIGEYKLFNRIKNTDSQKTSINILANKKKFQYAHPVKGTIEEKIKFLLNYSMGSQVYSVFRTKNLKKSNIFGYYNAWMADLALLLNVIKEGDLEVIEDTFMYKHVTKNSTSVIKYMINQKYRFTKILFLESTFTLWCLKNLGVKNFQRNFIYFVKLNLKGEYTIIAELIRMSKRIITKQEKYW